MKGFRPCRPSVLGTGAVSPAQGVEDLRLLLHLGPADLDRLRRRQRLALVQRLTRSRTSTSSRPAFPTRAARRRCDPAPACFSIRSCLAASTARTILRTSASISIAVASEKFRDRWANSRPRNTSFSSSPNASGPSLVAHAPLAHHAAGELGGMLDVALRARGDLVELSSSRCARLDMAMRSRTDRRFQLSRSSFGSIWVRPRAGPRGMMVTLCTGRCAR